MVDRNLREQLDRQMSKISLEEAQRVLAELRSEAQAAQKKVAEATVEVNVIKAKQEQQKQKQKGNRDGGPSNSGRSDHYSDKSFWDSRYGAEAEGDKNGTVDLYEWYLPFNEWKPHIFKSIPFNDRHAMILVSGCGNSGLCEDLAEVGFTNLVGFDYSQIVVTAMQQRCAQRDISQHVRYFCGDARDLSTEANDSYSYIIDKGTLDAIASGGTANGGSEETNIAAVQDVVRYMLEVWRLLRTSGKFILLSTMPPDVFYSLGMEPLLIKGETQQMCDWPNALKTCLQTLEGSPVWHYEVTRICAPSKTQRDAILNKHILVERGGTSKSHTNKDDIMLGIQALLDEAKQAKLDLDAATAKCAMRTTDARDALDSLNATELERARMERKLADSGAELEEEEDHEMKMMMSATTSEGGQANEDASVVLESMPNVSVHILPNESNLFAGGHVVVQYSLHEGDWHEDDAIYLICHQGHAAMYKPTDSEHYDHLEYTTKPSVSGRGRTKMSLPSHCAFYSVHYVRTIIQTLTTTKGGNAQIKRTSHLLAKSESFLVPAPVFRGHPDARGGNYRDCTDMFVTDNRQLSWTPPMARITETSVRRRGVGIIGPFDELSCTLIEDLRNIKTLSFSLQYSNRDDVQVSIITRVMAWATVDVFGGGEDKKKLVITFEADVARLDTSGAKVLYLNTRYAQVSVPVPNTGLTFNLNGSQVELVEMSKQNAQGVSSVVVCRIPYEISSSIGSFSLVRNADISLGEKKPTTTVAASECGFCGNELVHTSRIAEILTLPSGLLDNVMHEFICSEASPTIPLCISDLSTPQGSIMVGPLHANVNPADITPGSVVLACKDAPTILDLFSGNGGSLATTPLPDTAGRGAGTMSSIISIDSCLVLCARCGSYVGDGQIDADCPCPTHITADSSTVQPPAPPTSSSGTDRSKSENFILSDLRDVRMAKHCVDLSLQHCAVTAGENGASQLQLLQEKYVSSEQALSRIMVHLNTVFTVASFLLFLPQKPSADMIIVRFLSSRYAISFPADKGCFRVGIKVSFRIGNKDSLSLTGNEARIPLQHHEMQAVSNKLVERSIFFGPSIFKNHSLSVILM